MYLCIPSATGADDRICEWAYAQLLWRRDARTRIDPANADLAAEVAIERSATRLRAARAADHG